LTGILHYELVKFFSFFLKLVDYSLRHDYLHIDEKKVDLLFTKPQVVLKKGLDYDSA
jgi:hypothetical protein